MQAKNDPTNKWLKQVSKQAMDQASKELAKKPTEASRDV